jgi:hypothetical protein
MADSQSNAAQPTDGGSGRGYALPDKAAPLPRQWQLPPPQALVARGPGNAQHLFSTSTAAGNWQQARPSRWMDRALLLGLWLLVMLTAIAIGLRMLDLSAMTASPAEPQARAHALADAAEATHSVARAAARLGASDAFDKIVPLPEPLPVPPSTTQLTLSPTLAIDHPTAPVPADVVTPASREPACADALRAMQLCPN